MVVQRYLWHLLHQFWLSCATSPSEVEGQIPLGMGQGVYSFCCTKLPSQPLRLGLMMGTEVTVICPVQNV